jgi:hypothetical protein
MMAGEENVQTSEKQEAQCIHPGQIELMVYGVRLVTSLAYIITTTDKAG